MVSFFSVGSGQNMPLTSRLIVVCPCDSTEGFGTPHRLCLAASPAQSGRCLRVAAAAKQGQPPSSTNDERKHGQIPASEAIHVISTKFEGDDIYGTYLTTLVYLMEGSNQIYDELAQEMFGKTSAEITNNWQANGELQEAYHAVRKVIPPALSITD